jgi:hypothetical protein
VAEFGPVLMRDGAVNFSLSLAALATPIVLAGFGFVLSRRLNRNTELLKLRVEYYKVLAPDLNTLMCYMTFIGTWARHSPGEIVALKRTLDSNAYVAIPLFSDDVGKAFNAFMDACFEPFGGWGVDARIISGPYRRRAAWRRSGIPWDDAWDAMFTKRDTDAITGTELQHLRKLYDELLGTLVEDLKVTKPRPDYTTQNVVLNAHAEPRDDIPGRPLEDPEGPAQAEVNPFHSMSDPDPDDRERS